VKLRFRKEHIEKDRKGTHRTRTHRTRTNKTRRKTDDIILPFDSVRRIIQGFLSMEGLSFRLQTSGNRSVEQTYSTLNPVSPVKNLEYHCKQPLPSFSIETIRHQVLKLESDCLWIRDRRIAPHSQSMVSPDEPSLLSIILKLHLPLPTEAPASSVAEDPGRSIRFGGRPLSAQILKSHVIAPFF
jgi:hypothetical protein